jgi:hypothetical protein
MGHGGNDRGWGGLTTHIDSLGASNSGLCDSFSDGADFSGSDGLGCWCVASLHCGETSVDNPHGLMYVEELSLHGGTDIDGLASVGYVFGGT